MSYRDVFQRSESPRQTLPGFEHFNRFWLQQRSCFAVKIKPGELYVTNTNEAITTLLGSCVAACVRDPVAGIGGMNHFLLPASDDDRVAALSDATRYGAYAMEKLINEIMKHGGRKERLEIKIAGGGNMVRGMTDIGDQNVRFVTQYLNYEGFDIASADTGGEHPRNVVYLPQEGRLLVKKLGTIHNSKLFEVESRLKQRLASSQIGGAVELF
ncbi:chemoreceptor glutamine deamidase CheD [Neptunomonas sp.]|uniref:chemoreceptor glutamine deamidase CheD n=1 Tax=Neptunomonas sp. TaxID=1971898 RepID=UPI0035679924